MTRRTFVRHPTRLLLLVGFTLSGGSIWLPRYLASAANPPAADPPQPQQSVATDSPTPTPSPSPSSTPTPTPLPTETATLMVTPTSTPTPTQTQTSSPSPTGTSTALSSSTPTVPLSSTMTETATNTVIPGASTTPSATPSATTTPSGTATQEPRATPYPPQSVMINEIAWAGTLASAHDEWIELHNPGLYSIDLGGWVLTDDGDINVSLSGTIHPHSFYLLERTDDTTVSDIGADRIYTGALRNSGEILWLKDPTGAVVDSANKSGGGWPAGDLASHATMERIGRGDTPGNWRTFTGYGGVGHDAGGNPIAGTPRHPNSVFGPTPTPIASATPTPASTPLPPLSILINEVAWAGTHTSSNDEWIELHNPGVEEIELTGWTLTDGGDIDITLTGTIAGHGFFLLERFDDSVVSDIAADQLYRGVLNNSGETLWLKAPSGIVIDSANINGGGWPAGQSSSLASMERRGGEDIPSNWASFNGFHGRGHDADGSPIPGTPRGVNSILFPTPVPTRILGKVRINEVLIRPHYDWEGDGKASTGDEFIELYNQGRAPIFLGGWRLDDILDGGSRPYILPGVTLAPGEYVAFFRSRTHISLNDHGDSVHLLAPNGQIVDHIRYLRVRAYNLSYGRLPDGSDELSYGLWPTPGGPNLLFVEFGSGSLGQSPEIAFPFLCPTGGRPSPRFPRAARHPSQVGWWIETGFFICDEIDS